MTAMAAQGPEARTRTRSSFYVWMAWISLLAAFAGFAPTYWVPLAAGQFRGNPVIHFHGVIFFAWTVLFLVQTMQVQSGQIARHRALGMAGVSMATAMTILGILAALNSLAVATALGAKEGGEAFSILPVLGIAFFATVFTLAVVNARRPETHKRLMLLATVSILEAPLARPFFAWVFTDLPPGPPPVWAALPAAFLADLLIVAAIVFDWRTRGRPHPVYLWGGGALLAIQLLRVPISATPAWHDLMAGFLTLAGSPPA